MKIMEKIILIFIIIGGLLIFTTCQMPLGSDDNTDEESLDSGKSILGTEADTRSMGFRIYGTVSYRDQNGIRKYIPNCFVMALDKDTGIGEDDLMGTTYTNLNGYYSIQAPRMRPIPFNFGLWDVGFAPGSHPDIYVEVSIPNIETADEDVAFVTSIVHENVTEYEIRIDIHLKRNPYYYMTGDFNGDGMDNFIKHEENTGWRVFLSTGNSFNTSIWISAR